MYRASQLSERSFKILPVTNEPDLCQTNKLAKPSVTGLMSSGSYYLYISC